MDWRECMRLLGGHERRLREALGLSQDELARLAGVSQGSVSRLEQGRALGTPFLVVLKINLAMASVIGTCERELLGDEVARLFDLLRRLVPSGEGPALPFAGVTDEVHEVVRNLHAMSARERQVVLSVVRVLSERVAR